MQGNMHTVHALAALTASARMLLDLCILPHSSSTAGQPPCSVGKVVMVEVLRDAF